MQGMSGTTERRAVAARLTMTQVCFERQGKVVCCILGRNTCIVRAFLLVYCLYTTGFNSPLRLPKPKFCASVHARSGLSVFVVIACPT